MKQKLKYNLLACVAFIFIIISAFSSLNVSNITVFDDTTPIPTLGNDYYIDQLGILSSETKATINSKSKQLDTQDGTQVFVLTVDNLVEDPHEWAVKAFNNYKLGDADKNNGLLMILARRPNGKHNIDIITGYGLENILPDGKVGRIIDDYMMEYFEDKKLDLGILAGYNKIVDVIRNSNVDANTESTADTNDLLVSENLKNTVDKVSELLWTAALYMGVTLLLVFIFVSVKPIIVHTYYYLKCGELSNDDLKQLIKAKKEDNICQLYDDTRQYEQILSERLEKVMLNGKQNFSISEYKFMYDIGTISLRDLIIEKISKEIDSSKKFTFEEYGDIYAFAGSDLREKVFKAVENSLCELYSVEKDPKEVSMKDINSLFLHYNQLTEKQQLENIFLERVISNYMKKLTEEDLNTLVKSPDDKLRSFAIVELERRRLSIPITTEEAEERSNDSSLDLLYGVAIGSLLSGGLGKTNKSSTYSSNIDNNHNDDFFNSGSSFGGWSSGGFSGGGFSSGGGSTGGGGAGRSF